MYLFILSACFTEFPERDFPPVITILSPSEEYRDQIDNPYNVGSFIPFEFLVVDPDSKLNTVTVVLSSNIDGTLYQGVPNADGNLSILLATLSAGEHQISISAEGDQNYISETFGIALNTPPPAPILTMLPEYPTTEDDLYVDILLVDDLDGDDVSFNVEWLRGGIIQPEEDSIYLPSDLTNKEERWYVRVTPSDSFGEGESISTSVIIGNAAPQFTSVSLSPEEVYNDQPILCESQVSDIDGDSIEISYRWELFSNGITVDLDESSELLLGRPNEISPNDRVYCHVTADDGEQLIEKEDQILIGNRNPEITDIIILPTSEIRAGTTLECIALGTDSDGDSFDFTYKWRKGADDTSGSLLAVGETLVLTTENVVKGEYVTCFATVEDIYGAASTSTSIAVVENTPPSMTFAVLSPSNPTTSDDILCYASAEDIDSTDTVTLEYQWSINGLPIVNSTDTLPSSSGFSFSDLVTCSVTPTDSFDNGAPMSETIQIENNAPQINSIEINPESIYTDSQVTATVDTNDPDGDTVSLTYMWYVDGALVQSGIYNNLDGDLYFDKNQSIYVDVIVSDSYDSTAETSASVSVQNSPPSEPEIYLSEYSINDDQVLCEIVTPSTDLDGDDIDYLFEWHNSQLLLTSGMINTNWVDDTVASSSTHLDDQFTCTVSASDGQDSVSTSTETSIIACELSYSYSIEEDLSDIYAPDPCWEIGKTDTLPPVSFSDFVNMGTDSTQMIYNCLSSACVAHNPTDETVYYSYGYFPGGAVAFHPDDTGITMYPGFRWTAPTNGTCQLTIEVYGITSYATASTDVNVLLYQLDAQQNISLLGEAFVNGYQNPEEFDLLIPVSSGDLIYLLVEGNSHYDWLGVRGDISCVY